MALTDSINIIKNEMKHLGINQEDGLGTELFHFASTLMPVVNVDIVVINSSNQILLSWRDDVYTGIGWHIPGRCIRFGETINDAIQKCAMEELKTKIYCDDKPIRVMEFISHINRPIEDQRERAHFITLSYKCFVPEEYTINNGDKAEHDDGYLRWFNDFPEDLYYGHEVYREIWDSLKQH